MRALKTFNIFICILLATVNAVAQTTQQSGFVRLITQSVSSQTTPVSGAKVVIYNTVEISALEVSNLYRHRWDIEVFFKWIKQNIVVKTLWGFSQNAVTTRLWVAIITYLLIAWIKAECNSPYSITEMATLIRVSALEKVHLRDLITKPKAPTECNQYFTELCLFDDI